MHHTYVYPTVTPVTRQALAPPVPAPYRMTGPVSQRDLVRASLSRRAESPAR